MSHRALIAIPLAGLLAGLSLLHAYWAIGGRWGSAHTVPFVNGKPSFHPSPLATWAVCGLLASAALLAIGKASRIAPGPLASIIDVGLWTVSVVFLLRAIGDFRTFGYLKTLRDTPFAQWDTWLYSPLCLLLALLAVALARAVTEPRP